MTLKMGLTLVVRFLLRIVDYVRDSWLPLFEDGREVWVVSHDG